jgi:hypothetical protein
VMYEIANEPPLGSANWVAQVMTEVSNYESTTYGIHHPIGINYGNSIDDSNVYNTNADYVSPSTEVPPDATGQCPVVTGNGGAANTSSGRCKVVLNDSDHSYYFTYMQSDGPTGQTAWVWKNFLHGNGVAFEDLFTYSFWPGRNNCTGAPVDGDAGLCATSGLDPQWNQIRSAVGDIVTYAKQVNLVNMTPQDSLSTSGYCLANPGSQYLAFSTSNTFTLTTVAGTYTYEWFNPATHTVVQTGTVTVGSSQRFTAPFGGAAVLWLHQ